MSEPNNIERQATARDELPDDRFRSHGVLEPESQAREYRMAAGGAAATSAGLAFNVVAAMASDAGQAVARRMQSLDFRGDEAARERRAAKKDSGRLGSDGLSKASQERQASQDMMSRASSGSKSGHTPSRATSAGMRMSSIDRGRSGLVCVGEDECREWCKEQRLQKARSQALHSTHSGSSMNRQGSVLSQQYGPTSATSAAKAFGDFVKQESTRLQSAAPNASRYQRHDEFDEEDEIEGDGEEETLETTGDGGVGMGGAETTVRPRKRKGRHYDAKDDVILRLEALPPLEVKRLVIALWVSTTLAGVFLLAEFILKFEHSDVPFSNHKHVPVMNAVVGIICLAILIGRLGRFTRRLISCHKLHRRWAARRYSHSMLAYAELVIGVIVNINFVVPNLYLLAVPCSWQSHIIPWCSLVRWTCYNCIFLLIWIHAHNAVPWHQELAGSSKVIRRIAQTEWKQAPEDAIVLDAGFLYHWPKYLYWLLFEGMLLAVVLNYCYGTNEDRRPPNPFPGQDPNADCDQLQWHCRMSNTQIALVTSLIFLAYLYFAFYFFNIRRANRMLANESYAKYKMGCILIRLHQRLRFNMVLFFALSLALLHFVHLNSCRSYIETWGGLLPVQIVMTAMVCCWAHLMTPADPRKTSPVLGVWLQEFAWTEEDKEEDMKSRSASTGKLSAKDASSLQKQPMFCMETAVNMFYWSVLVYDHEEALESKVLLDTAMSLYNLEHSELYWEKAQDTKLLIAWNHDTIVIAFRGTSSMANALADLQAWQTIHPPRRGRGLRRPKVHIGFHKSWIANDLDQKVKERVMEIIKDHKGTTKMYITGHSLGGALATLAAYDLKNVADKAKLDVHISCYTYGAPRVGNHSFAEDFDRVINNCFHVVNHQDVVPKAPKFFIMYKRAGYRVIINHNGDMIVRPSAIEASVQVAGNSVAHHLMGSYQRSLLAIMLAQFTRKRFAGGMAGVVRLASRNVTVQELLMEEAGLDVPALRRLSKWGDMAPHIGAKIAPRLEVKQNQTLLRIPSMQGRLMRSISAKGMAVSESTARFGKRMMSMGRRDPKSLATVEEDGQDDDEGTDNGDSSPPAEASASGAALPRAGGDHSLREKFAEERPKPTLAGTAKDESLLPSAPAFSPFAALAGSAIDAKEDDSLEVGMLHERGSGSSPAQH